MILKPEIEPALNFLHQLPAKHTVRPSYSYRYPWLTPFQGLIRSQPSSFKASHGRGQPSRVIIIRYSYRSYKFGGKQKSQFLLPHTSTRSKHFEFIAGDPASNSTGNPGLSSTIIVNKADMVVSGRSWTRGEVGPLLNDNQIQIDGCTSKCMVGHALEPAQSSSDTTNEQAEDETSGDESITASPPLSPLQSFGLATTVDGVDKERTINIYKRGRLLGAGGEGSVYEYHHH